MLIPKAFPAVSGLEQTSRQALIGVQRRHCMAIRAIQAAVREHWQSSVRLIAVAMWGVGLVGCAELGAIRSEMARLRADLMAYHTAMESLTERVQAIEQRGATSESGV